MTKFIALLAILFFSLIAAIRADDLDDASAICKPHLHHPEAANVWVDAGWEHCLKIAEAIGARQAAADKARQAADAADEKKNPDLKMTRDLARKLSEQSK